MALEIPDSMDSLVYFSRRKFTVDKGTAIAWVQKMQCPKCKKVKAERIISAGGGIIFKGSGFYQTDYRSDSYKKGADAAKKASEGPAPAAPASTTAPDSRSSDAPASGK